MPLPNFPFTVLDTETTGFIPKTNRVIEFASMRFEKGEVIDRLEQLIAIPNNDVPPVIQVLTRIQPEALAKKPMFEECIATIREHIGDNTVIIGQNIGFDLRMLKGEGLDLSERPWIDTSMLASLVFPELASYSLSYVSTVLKLHHAPVHRAMGDVVATSELLERCWERFLELPQEELDILRTFLGKSSKGYRILAQALPVKELTTLKPKWMEYGIWNMEYGMKSQKKTEVDNDIPHSTFHLPHSSPGTLHLITDAFGPHSLHDLIVSALHKKSTGTTWIGVKNLEAALRRCTVQNKNVRVLHPPFLLLDPHSADRLAEQMTLTADEASLLVKIFWYRPKTQGELPIHGEERAVWSGKLACTEHSEEYSKQFDSLPSVILLDQRQLLSFVATPESVGYRALHEEGTPAHIVIDDASMLEDTATKSFGHSVSLDSLRAAAESDSELTSFVDHLQIWIERTRNFRDLHFITSGDLSSNDAELLRKRLDTLLKGTTSHLLTKMLLGIRAFLASERLSERITYIEQRQNGSQYLESVPLRIGPLLREHLYERYTTTLLLPPMDRASFQEILPTGMPVTSSMEPPKAPYGIEIHDARPLAEILRTPPPGKTIVLLGSKKVIEDAFIHHTERLEKEGVTLICQNFSGGQERMQAEFCAAASPTVWLLTPWTYETVELPQETADHLILATLPFDHPDQPVFSHRSACYRDGFGEYSLPRLKARLFRVLRTFSRHSTAQADVCVFDDRLKTKKYGKEVREFLLQFSKESLPKTDKPEQMKLL